MKHDQCLAGAVVTFLCNPDVAAKARPGDVFGMSVDRRYFFGCNVWETHGILVGMDRGTKNEKNKTKKQKRKHKQLSSRVLEHFKPFRLKGQVAQVSVWVLRTRMQPAAAQM